VELRFSLPNDRHIISAGAEVVRYTWNDEERMGYDFAVVRLDRAVSDAGDPPLLYAGDRERGKRMVMVGYGSRGIGSVGQHPAYQPSWGKAAADWTAPPDAPFVRLSSAAIAMTVPVRSS